MKKKVLVCCAMGEPYVALTRRMIDSFMRHNCLGWDVMEFYDEDLRSLVPLVFQGFTDFDTCEIGRFYAIQKALETYDTALYCDGDIRWYDKYIEHENGLVLTPHYVTKQAQKANRNLEFRTGFTNTGLIEMNKTDETADMLDYIFTETQTHMPRIMFNGKLWEQNFVHMIPLCGFDAVYNLDAGINVAYWNLKRGDRKLIKRGDGYIVETVDGVIAPLKCFHFSSSGMKFLDEVGARDLRKEYQNESRR